MKSRFYMISFKQTSHYYPNGLIDCRKLINLNSYNIPPSGSTLLLDLLSLPCIIHDLRYFIVIFLNLLVSFNFMPLHLRQFSFIIIFIIFFGLMESIYYYPNGLLAGFLESAAALSSFHLASFSLSIQLMAALISFHFLHLIQTSPAVS